MSESHVNNRSLKFPNARLFVHELLVCGRAASEAIIHSACELGLVDRECLGEILPLSGAVPCACMASARNVIARYCEQRGKQPNEPKLNKEQIWAVLQGDAQAYAEECNPTNDLDFKVNSHDCSKFAPALFDLLLQELSRHPQ
jgi:hypothetical protein